MQRVTVFVYDPAKVSYEQLLAVYWKSIDPTTRDRQFCDAGSPYRTAIFALDAAQLKAMHPELNKGLHDALIQHKTQVANNEAQLRALGQRSASACHNPFDRCGHVVHFGHAVDPGGEQGVLPRTRDRAFCPGAQRLN